MWDSEDANDILRSDVMLPFRKDIDKVHRGINE